MAELWTSFLVALVAIFVVVEPFGVVPMFATLTRDKAPDEARRIALRASVAGAVILIGFVFGGRLLLEALSVRIDSFRMAGGLLLLLTALEMLRGKVASCRCSTTEVQDATNKEDIAIVPVAVPLLAGPGSMATVMVLTSTGTTATTAAVVTAILVTFVASYFVLRSSVRLQRMLGPSTMAVVQRLFGLVLAAVSIEFIVRGGLGLIQ